SIVCTTTVCTVSVALSLHDALPILVGHDRPGIVRELSGSLARRRVSIEDLHTEIVSGATPAEQLFKVKALLVVPEQVPNDELRRALEPLMKEMTVDIALGENAVGA